VVAHGRIVNYSQINVRADRSLQGAFHVWVKEVCKDWVKEVCKDWVKEVCKEFWVFVNE